MASNVSAILAVVKSTFLVCRFSEEYDVFFCSLFEDEDP